MKPAPAEFARIMDPTPNAPKQTTFHAVIVAETGTTTTARACQRVCFIMLSVGVYLQHHTALRTQADKPTSLHFGRLYGCVSAV